VLFATFITLVFVPAVYMILDDVKQLMHRGFARPVEARS